MKAVVFLGDKTAAVVDRPVPKLQDHYLLVKPVAVALNPTDLSHILMPFAAPGCIMGCDYAGIVEEVGSKVTKEFKKGDRVCGFSHGGNISQKEEGTFAEHIVCIGDLQMKIPDSLSFEQAATLGVSVGTVGQGLFEQTGLELAIPSRPTKEHETVMVYGGSTATGGLGIQLLKAYVFSGPSFGSPHMTDGVSSELATRSSQPAHLKTLSWSSLLVPTKSSTTGTLNAPRRSTNTQTTNSSIAGTPLVMMKQLSFAPRPCPQSQDVFMGRS